MRQSDTVLQSNKLSPVTLVIHYWYITDTLRIHYWYITDTLLLHYWYITDTVHYWYITVTLLIHYWYITDTLYTLQFESEKKTFFISLSLVATLNFLESPAVPKNVLIEAKKVSPSNERKHFIYAIQFIQLSFFKLLEFKMKDKTWNNFKFYLCTVHCTAHINNKILKSSDVHILYC